MVHHKDPIGSGIRGDSLADMRRNVFRVACLGNRGLNDLPSGNILTASQAQRSMTRILALPNAKTR